ncbi:MAG: M48 family metalloprotease [Cyclobacteriaceae bacterium]
MFSGLLLWQSCDDAPPDFFSLENEISLAQELQSWVASDTIFSVLAEEEYPLTYAYANASFENLLGLSATDSISEVVNKDNFEWSLFLLNTEELNAFVTPGGQLYISTSLIKLLEAQDELASVLAHLIVHADERHVTKQLLNFFSSSDLKQAAGGTNESMLNDIAEHVFGRRTAFSFSYGDEQTAEVLTVKHLSSTSFACDASILFNQKLEKQVLQGNPPSFNDLHAFETDKSTIINEQVGKEGCNTELIEESGFTFADFKNSLP